MSRWFLGFALLTALVAATASPMLAQAQKKKKQEVIDAAKLLRGDFVGILEKAPGSDRLFTVEVEQDYLVPTRSRRPPAINRRATVAPNLVPLRNAQVRVVQAQQRGAMAQQRMATARNPGQARSAQSELTRAQGDLVRAVNFYQQALGQYIMQANLQTNMLILANINRYRGRIPTGFRVQKTKTPIEFQAAESVQVRTAILPEQFDEKGKPKKYTKEELAQLKGKDRLLPGYESTLESLQPGMVVRVSLVPSKKIGKKKPSAAGADKEDDAKDDEAARKMQVLRIVILSEGPQNDSKAGKGKK